jgi:ketosteroid isomerase-like protein
MSASNRLMVVLMALVFTASFSAAAAPTQIEEEVLAAEAIYVNSDAGIDDRQSILYGVKTKSTIYHRIIATERKARVTGEIALVTGVAAIRGVERKEHVDLTVRYMAVYMKRDGRWQMTAGQATQLVPTNNAISGQPA